MKLFDFVIIGAGCAGLAVARELNTAGYLGSVLIVESKKQFDNDKSWSFWATKNSPWFQLARHRWSYSSVCTADTAVRLSYRDYRYCMIPSIDYYKFCCDKLSANTKLCFNTVVDEINCNPLVETSPYTLLNANHTKQTENTSKFTLTLNDGSVIGCKQLLDTRPRFQQPRYFQQFKGFEVELENAIANPGTVRLMENIQTTHKGVLFFYILPLTPTHLLIEPTYFGNEQQDYDWLESLAFDWLKKNHLFHKKILRTEQGLLPMGGITTDKVSYDLGGIVGDHLKGASGYGFLNIQQWSIDYVDRFVKHKSVEKKSLRLKLLHLMDDLFIDVLIAKPMLTPELMLQTAIALPGDNFAKFMTEQSTLSELTRLLWKFPKSPFLKALYIRACCANE